MEVSALEIIELSLLFGIPAIVVMLISYIVTVCISLAKQKRVVYVFHWIDLFAPFLVTTIWCLLQAHSMNTKSMGNLAEIGVLGLGWGCLFVIRCWRSYRGELSPILKLLLIECVVSVLVALFAPTFSE